MDKMTRLRQCAIRLVLMPEYPMHEFNVLARLGLRIPDMTDKKMRTGLSCTRTRMVTVQKAPSPPRSLCSTRTSPL